MVKNLPAKAGDLGDTGLIPESGKSPGGGLLFVLARAAQRCQVLESKCTLEKQFDLWEQEILNKF